MLGAERKEGCDDRRGVAAGLLNRSDCISDDDHLRSIDSIVHSIKEARREPDYNGVTHTAR